MFKRVHAWLAGLSGIKRYATAFGFGLLMTLALPPIGAFYVLLLCVPALVWLTRQCKTKKEAFLTGWAFGAGYFIFGLYWVSVALLVDIQSFWWALPLSAVAGPAALALFYAFIPLLVWRYRAHEAAYALMLVTGWALIEWLRGHILTGFPWNLPGYTWHMFLPVLQANAFIGIYGLTLLTLLWAVMPVLAATPQRKLVPALTLLFLMVTAGGAVRLHLHQTEQFDHYTVRIVQPNIPQSLKWDQQAIRNNFQKHLALTALPAAQPVTFVVWPETAITADLRQYPDISRYIGKSLPTGSIGLLGNLYRGDAESFYNSLVVLDKRFGIRNVYHKHHLVPFGEYIPFRHYLNMTPIAAGISMVGDFTRGAGITTLHIGVLPKPSPLICYEAIFPGEVARRDDRPDWLVNVTNDAWYGRTAGPHQHFENARVRAIEEGLPLVRAANTGISGTIDPLGRMIGIKKLGETGIVDTLLPRPLPPTLYAKFGDTLFFLMLILLAIAGETLRAKGK